MSKSPNLMSTPGKKQFCVPENIEKFSVDTFKCDKHVVGKWTFLNTLVRSGTHFKCHRWTLTVNTRNIPHVISYSDWSVCLLTSLMCAPSFSIHCLVERFVLSINWIFEWFAATIWICQSTYESMHNNEYFIARENHSSESNALFVWKMKYLASNHIHTLLAVIILNFN